MIFTYIQKILLAVVFGTVFFVAPVLAQTHGGSVRAEKPLIPPIEDCETSFTDTDATVKQVQDLLISYGYPDWSVSVQVGGCEYESYQPLFVYITPQFSFPTSTSYIYTYFTSVDSYEEGYLEEEIVELLDEFNESTVETLIQSAESEPRVLAFLEYEKENRGFIQFHDEIVYSKEDHYAIHGFEGQSDAMTVSAWDEEFPPFLSYYFLPLSFVESSSAFPEYKTLQEAKTEVETLYPGCEYDQEGIMGNVSMSARFDDGASQAWHATLIDKQYERDDEDNTACPSWIDISIADDGSYYEIEEQNRSSNGLFGNILDGAPVAIQIAAVFGIIATVIFAVIGFILMVTSRPEEDK